MKVKYTLLVFALMISFGLYAQPSCNLSNYNSMLILNANSYPYTSPTSGITVSANAAGVPTLNNFNYSCGGQVFSTVAPAWWLNSAAQTITLTFSAPVTNFSVVVNGTNINEEFYFTPNSGTITLSNYCASGFTAINGGTALLSTGSAATGTLISVNNNVGATQYVLTHNGVGSGSRIALLDCITATVLPVEYLSFDLSEDHVKQTVQLQWETQNEVNNSGFDVEHSIDGLEWSKVGRVEATRSRNGSGTYSFDHRPGVDGDHFYRLKQVDLDGSYFYSEVRQANLDLMARGLSAFPNPSAGSFTVVAEGVSGQMVVSDVLGKVVERRNFDQQAQIDLSQFGKGVYLLKVTAQDGQSYQKKLWVR